MVQSKDLQQQTTVHPVGADITATNQEASTARARRPTTMTTSFATLVTTVRKGRPRREKEIVRWAFTATEVELPVPFLVHEGLQDRCQLRRNQRQTVLHVQPVTTASLNSNWTATATPTTTFVNISAKPAMSVSEARSVRFLFTTTVMTATTRSGSATEATLSTPTPALNLPLKPGKKTIGSIYQATT